MRALEADGVGEEEPRDDHEHGHEDSGGEVQQQRRARARARRRTKGEAGGRVAGEEASTWTDDRRTDGGRATTRRAATPGMALTLYDIISITGDIFSIKDGHERASRSEGCGAAAMTAPPPEPPGWVPVGARRVSARSRVVRVEDASRHEPPRPRFRFRGGAGGGGGERPGRAPAWRAPAPGSRGWAGKSGESVPVCANT